MSRQQTVCLLVVFLILITEGEFVRAVSAKSRQTVPAGPAGPEPFSPSPPPPFPPGSGTSEPSPPAMDPRATKPSTSTSSAAAATSVAPPSPEPPGPTTTTSKTTPKVAVVTSPSWCYHDETRYKHGDKWEPNACTHCHCMFGRSVCYVIDCFFAECVDFEYVPGKCCPICPNGPNCNLNGTIVPVGQEVQKDPHTTCTCLLPDSGMFAFRRPGVMCTTVLERPSNINATP